MGEAAGGGGGQTVPNPLRAGGPSLRQLPLYVIAHLAVAAARPAVPQGRPLTDTAPHQLRPTPDGTHATSSASAASVMPLHGAPPSRSRSHAPIRLRQTLHQVDCVHAQPRPGRARNVKAGV